MRLLRILLYLLKFLLYILFSVAWSILKVLFGLLVIIGELLKLLAGGETQKERENRIKNNIFEDKCRILGFNKEEKEDCFKSGLDPEDWLKDHNPELYDELDL